MAAHTAFVIAVLSGFVEAAYHVDFSNPNVDQEQIPALNCYTPAGNTFVLHSAHLALSHAFNDEVSATLELDAGYDATKTAPYPFNGSFFDAQETYASYHTGHFSVTVGRFAGYEGLEVIEGPFNPTITRGYSYNMAEPNTHTGVKLHYTTDTIDLGLGGVNGWDTLVDNNTGKTLLWKLGVTPSDAFTINVNGTFGPEQDDVNDVYRLSLDLDASWTVCDRFELRFQTNYGMDGLGSGDAQVVRWYVFGLQSVYTTEMFKLGARAEFFGDPDGARAAMGPTNLINVTLTPGLILAQGFEVRAELRGDLSTGQPFRRGSHSDRGFISAAAAAAYIF